VLGFLMLYLVKGTDLVTAVNSVCALYAYCAQSVVNQPKCLSDCFVSESTETISTKPRITNLH